MSLMKVKSNNQKIKLNKYKNRNQHKLIKNKTKLNKLN